MRGALALDAMGREVCRWGRGEDGGSGIGYVRAMQ